jgi:uncharacterized protein (TIGR00369 family)
MQHGATSPAEAASEAPFLRTLGARLEEVTPQHARLALPHREENGNRNGTLHGGVVAAAIDVVAATAASAGLDPARRRGASTIDLTVHFLAPASHEDLVATAVVSRRGRDITFVDATVATESGKPIARGLVAHRAGPATARGSAAALAPERRAVEEPPPELLARARPSGSPFTARIGVVSTQLGRGRAVSLLPCSGDLLADDGSVHEGALAALVDCAGGAASWSIDGFTPHGRAATIGMHLCFDAGTRDEDVLAEAVTSWCSGGVYVNSVTVAGRTSGRAIASGSVTYRIASRERRS